MHDALDAHDTIDGAESLADLAERLEAARDRRAACSALVRALIPSLGTWCTLHACDRGDDPALAREVRLLAAAHVEPAAAARLRESERARARALPALPAPGLHANGRLARLALRTREGLPDESAPDAVLAVGRDDTSAPFTPAELRRLEQVARVAGVALRALGRLEQGVQHHAEAEARRQRLTATLESIVEGFVLLDRQWRVTWANRAALAILGGTLATLVGADGRALVPGRDDPARREALDRAMHAGDAARYDARLGELWVEVRAYATPEGLAVHLLDVSERHRGEAAMAALLAHAEAARADAEAANQAKADFLASMSHELRTPLNAILGYVSLLADGITGPVMPAQVQQLDRVAASARHLLSLIEEILSFARLESGREVIVLDTVDAVELGAEVARLIEPVIAAHGLRFEVALPERPLPLLTDARKVRQMLLNLLANAGRFTPPGGRVTLGLVPDESGGACFTVRDTGIGIAPEHHERIFEAFWQVEQGRTRQVGGTGLGLSVTRRYARLLGGDVGVESSPGAGAAFSVRLPREAPRVEGTE